MDFFFNPTNVLSAIYAILNNDSTLQGASYLNGIGHVFTLRAPTSATKPFIVITLDQLTPDEMQHYQCEVRVFCYTTLLANGQIDSRGSLILSRCEELLNNVSPVISGATVQPLMALGLVPPFIDAADPSNARGLLRLRLETGKN